MPFVQRRRRAARPRARRRAARAAAIAPSASSIPFKWYPKEELLAQAAAWRLIDLSEANGEPIDLVDRDEVPDLLRAASEQGHAGSCISTARIYDLCGTPYSEFDHTRSATSRLREQLIALDTEMLGESRRLFTNARNTAARLATLQRPRRPSRCTIRRRSPAGCSRARSATTSCRSAGSKRNKRVDLDRPRARARRSRACG